ncbi:MAG: SsrA-binding protein, partial [bacterium]|nr:SsrA-binding protein [bacterium]
YAPAAREQHAYDPTQPRDLLLKKKEIEYLRGKTDRTGLTLVPLRLYTHGKRVKLEIGLAKGKKQYDKRESIKKREVDRSIQRGEDI